MSRSHLEGYTQEDARKSWELLEQAITKIYEKKFYDLSYEELYRNSYFLVLHRHGDLAYQNLQNSIKSHLAKYYSRLPQAQEDNFLVIFLEIWNDAIEMMKAISRIFLYMERNYIPPKTLNPLKIVGYRAFLQVFLEDSVFGKKFQQQVLGLIRKERDGMNVDRILLKNIFGMLLELSTQASYSEQTSAPRVFGIGLMTTYNPQGNKMTCNLFNDKKVYKNYFEKEFLIETEAYYNEEAQRCISSMTATEYLNKAEQRCEEELNRVNFYLDDSTKTPLINTFMDVYILRHSKTITETGGIFFLFDSEMLNDIRKVYKMFLLSESSTELFYNTFQDYQKRNLMKILEPPSEEDKDPLIIIKNLLSFHKKILRIYKCLQEKELEREKIIYKIVKDSFEQRINANSKVTFLLNIYLDHQFREGFKCLKDPEVEAELIDILDIFRYVSDKDVFEKNYKVFLSKRLLSGKSLSEEHEKLFVSKLQQECGCYFTAKVETMFKDIALSAMTVSEFQASFAENALFQQNRTEYIKAFDVKVLTTGNWPLQESTTYNLPLELRDWTGLFEKYYIDRYPGRKLNWVLSQGTAELRANFGGKRKELLVTTHQMLILLLFNNKKTMKVKEILTQTMLPNEDVYNHLGAFTSLKVINKITGDSNKIDEEDEVEINDGFTHKSYRIKMPVKRIKEKGQENDKGLMEVVTIERKYLIEACIVRIMKSRKRLDHLQLIEEVMKLTALHQFKPDISLIKKVIEELIAKEYVERDPDNKNIYNYLS